MKIVLFVYDIISIFKDVEIYSTLVYFKRFLLQTSFSRSDILLCRTNTIFLKALSELQALTGSHALTAPRLLMPQEL